jgi:hypothetical protein
MVAGLCARSTLIVMVLWSLTFAGIGLVGHYAGASDGFLLLGWFGGLALYYQTMRRPGDIVRIVKYLTALPQFRWIRS